LKFEDPRAGLIKHFGDGKLNTRQFHFRQLYLEEIVMNINEMKEKFRGLESYDHLLEYDI